MTASAPTTGASAVADAAAADEAPRPAAAGGGSPREAWRWAALFLVPYLLLGVAWVASNPPGAAPDEPDHLVKAIGMGRLDIGDDLDAPLPDEPLLVRRNLSITRLVDVPADLDPSGYTCYAFRGSVTAGCLPDDEPEGAGSVEKGTPIGAYPPFEYVGMGVAARATDSPHAAFLAARAVALVSALAMVFVGAWFLVRELGRPALVGAFVALTPMVVFAGSTVTTSGVEIASAFAVGCLVTICLRRPGSLGRPRIQLALAACGTVLVLSRQMGAVTLAVLLVVLAAARWSEAWDLVRSRRPAFLGAVGLLVAAGVAVLLWERAFDHPTDTGTPVSRGAIREFVEGVPGVVESAVGVFGWLDTPLPLWATWLWVVAAVVICGLGLALGTARDRLALGAVLLATGAVTYTTYAVVFFPVGADSQGRHLLPLFVFCPVYAGSVIVDRLRMSHPAALRRLIVALGATAGLVQVVGLYVNARRYAVGVDGPVAFLGDTEWDPPAGWLPWLVIALAGGAALVAMSLAVRPPLAPAATAGDND